MPPPNPRLLPDSPLEIVDARVMFRRPDDDPARPRDGIRPRIWQRRTSTMTRLDSGRILFAFRQGTGPVRKDDGVVMLSHSDDDGRSWAEPISLWGMPAWNCMMMGGFNRFSDAHIRLYLGRTRLDPSLGGDEPFSDWWIAPIDSRDGGRTWSESGADLKLWPHWTEMYGASNPHRLSDGRFLFATMGTTGRDESWRAGVTFSDADGENLTPPVVIAQAPDRNFSDVDLCRLPDGRFLAVIREHVTRGAYWARSRDEGRTWSEVRHTGFKGANPKLFPARSGLVYCVYRDEEPTRRGVSCSVTADGGDSWRMIGQLYVADPNEPHIPGSLCGYPDATYVGSGEILMALHSYPDDVGRADIHLLRLRERG